MCQKHLDFLCLKSIYFYKNFSKNLQNSTIFVKINEISAGILGLFLLKFFILNLCELHYFH